MVTLSSKTTLSVLLDAVFVFKWAKKQETHHFYYVFPHETLDELRIWS